MITFSADIVDKLSKRTGQQPILLLEIDWVSGGTISYSDIDYPGSTTAVISVGTINRVDENQISNSISVVLDATNDTVETIFRANDVHLRPVRLYLTFPGILNKALLFNGLINSQVTWGEADRTLQFEVLDKLEDSLVGFTMEDGNFPYVTEDDRSKVWPLPFGTVCHYQAQRLTTTIKGYLVEGLGAVDPTLANRICQIEKTQCPNVTVPVNRPGPLPGSVVLSDTVPSPECLARKRNEGCILKDLLSRQQALASSTFTVKNGELFPQNTPITVKVGQVSYRGTMSGTTFTVAIVYHPDNDKIAQCRNVRSPSVGYRYGIGSEEEANKCGNQGNSANVSPGSANCISTSSRDIGGNRVSICGMNAGGNVLQQQQVGGAADSWKYYDQMQSGRFIWAPPGTNVVLSEYDDDLIYMVSLVPGTVTQVLSYRTFGDQKLLSAVPTDWYTVENVDYGGYQCVELRFNRLPSTTVEGGWGDDIYVSFVSSVGPNPVDIIEWLVETYTDFTVDVTNFSAIRTLMTEFGTNFVVQDRPSVLNLIREIAYQQRLAVRILDGVVTLVHLAKEPTALKTLTLTDIVQNSFKIAYTETEKLRTNHKIKWKKQYFDNVSGNKVEKELQLRYNIPKYGSSTENFDWYTQNTFEMVLHTTTFWLIRKSNTWMEVEFETALNHLDLDILDSVTLNISQFPNTKIVLTEKNYNSESNTIRWRAWTPIRAGETVPYTWAWPSTVTGYLWPLAGSASQAQVGDGSGLTVVPPVGHPLRIGYVGGESVPVSSGSSFPSDVGFVAPEIVCEVPLGDEVIFADTPIIDALAKQNFQQTVQEQQNAAINVEFLGKEDAPCTFSGLNPCPPDLAEIGDQSTDPPVDDEGETNNCRYLLTLNYVVPSLIGTGCGGPCNKVSGGVACAGAPVQVQSIMSSYEAAAAAVTSHQQWYEDYQCNQTLNVIGPAPGSNIVAYATNNTYYNVKPPTDVCPDVVDDPLDTLYNPNCLDCPEGVTAPDPSQTGPA